MNDLTPDLTSDDDAELVRRARSGDRAAFGRIIEHHQASAVRLATIISGDSTEAFDIVQDAFVKAFHAIPTLRDSGSLKPWLMRIVANQAKNTRRGLRRRELRDHRQASLRPDPVGGPDDEAMSNVRAQQLLAAIERLPARDRRIIACRYFADLSEAETAHLLDVPNGTVKSRTARAVARLRVELGEVNDV